MKYVKVEKDGQPLLDKERRLAYPLSAIKRMRSMPSVNLSGKVKVEDVDGLEAFSVMLWQGLLHEDKSLTQEQVEEMVDLSMVEDLMKLMNEAMGKDENQAEDPTKAKSQNQNGPQLVG